MANQAEVIDLRYEPGGATADAVRSANSIGEAYEKSAVRAGAAMEATANKSESAILRIVDRSRLGSERIIASIEKRTQALKSPLDQLAAQQASALDRIGGDPKGIERINAAFSVLISNQKQLEASARTNVVAELERRLATPATRLLQERAAALQKVSGDPAAVASVTANFAKLIAAEKAAAESAKGLELGERIKQGIENPIGSAGNAISGFVSKIGTAGVVTIAAVAGIGIAAKEAFDLVAESGKRAEGIVNLSDRLGTTIGEAQKLSAVARIVNVDIGSLESSSKKLFSALAEGGEDGKKGAQALLDIGVHARDSKGNLKGFYELFGQIADGLDTLPEHAQQAAALENIFGKGAISMLPMFKNLRSITAELDKLGIALDDDLIKRLAKGDDEIDKMGIAWDALKARLAGKIEPVVISAVVQWTNVLGGKTGSIKELLVNEFNNSIGNPLLNPIAMGVKQLRELSGQIKAEAPKIADIQQTAARVVPTNVFSDDQRRGQDLQTQFKARTNLEDLKLQIDAKEKDLKAAEAKLNQLGPDASSSVVISTQKQVLALRAQDDALKLNLKTIQELPERQKAAKEAALDAQAAELSGISKIIAERNKQIQQLSTVTDNGKTGKINLAKQAPDILAAVEATTQAKIRAEQRKTADELLSLDAKTNALRLENTKASLRTEEDLADSHLALLESKETLSRREIENERLRIHKQAIDAIAALDKKQLEDQAALEIRQIRQHQDIATDPRDKSADFARILAVRQQLALKTGQIDSAANAAQIKADEDLENQRILRNRQFADQSVTLQAQNLDREASLQESALGHRRDLELDSLALVDQQTLSGKLGVEQKRLEIETQFLKQSEDLQLASADRRLNTELALLDVQARREGVSDEERIRRRELLEQQFADERLGIEQDTQAAITSAALKEAAERTDAIRQHNLSIFEDLKRESEGVFDAMLTKGKNIFQAIGDSLKNAFLTAIKDVVSSRVAASLTQLVTGQKVTLVQENQGAGPLGKILTALGVGAKPVFGTQPTFKTKLDDPNHIGDVLLRGGAVPVFIQNAGQDQQQQSGLSSLPFGLGGATAALATVLGLGALGGVAKAAPTGVVQSTIDFGGFGGSAPSTSAGQVFGSGGIFGAPGGTAPFAPGPGQGFGGFLKGIGQDVFGSGRNPSGFPTGPAGPMDFPGAPSQGGGIFGSLKSSLSGFKGILSSLGNIGIGGASSIPTSIGTGSAQTAAGIPGLGAPAALKTGGLFAGKIGGVAGGALLAGGGALAFDGLRRGGLAGLGETTAGGALIGLKFGGPVGALIGAGVGAIAGTIRLFMKSGAEKVVSKVKAIYGIDIDKKFAQDPILGIIKQNFGGNVDVGLRSPQIRDLLELYATTTDQKSSGIVNKIQQSTFANQGGSLVNIPNLGLTGAPVGFSAGSAIGNGIIFGLGTGSGPQFAPAAAAPAAPQNISVSVKLDGDSTKQFVQGQQVDAIKANPRAVSTANNEGLMTSAARRSTQASVLQPNFITG